MNNNVRPETMERINNKALAQAFINEQVEIIRKQVGDKKVLLALSGGVDSSVVAALLIKAIGKQLVCVHVNHGLLRKGEPEEVVEVFGAHTEYSRTISMTKCPLAVGDKIWFGVKPTDENNYTVAKIADSKNGFLIALREVSPRG